MQKDQPIHIGVGLFAKKLFWSCDIEFSGDIWIRFAILPNQVQARKDLFSSDLRHLPSACRGDVSGRSSNEA
jgi:hypothetical protein